MTDSLSMEIDAFMVGPTRTWWDHLKGGLTKDLNYFDPDYQLYVPERFYLGQFKERNGYYRLSPEILYQDLPENLRQYEQLLREGKLRIVKDISIPEDLLADIVTEAKNYRAASFEIRGCIATLESQGLLTAT